ncbi:MAG: hypothetical protein NZ551_02980 [Microscillaceae bacterium]|nr:hypothetical protein [Microscillaceae bacterium]MDW8460152.1 hypothetical protein [Cytophagales bacterium]
MKRIISLLILMLWFSVAWGQYKSKSIVVKHDEYEGSLEVCENCQDIKPQASKIYAYWDSNEVVTNSEGSFKGKLLHGKADLKYKEGGTPYLQAEFVKGEPNGNYKEWLPDGTLLKDENYLNGVKHGICKYYLFGKLETEELYDQGKLKTITYFSAETEKPERKVEYLQSDGNIKKSRAFYMSANSQTVEVEQLELWEGKELKTIYYDGKYKRYHKNGIKEEGTYSKNERIGEWKQYYEDGVVATRKYENDRVVSEIFTKDGKNFSGVVIDKYISGKLKSQYNVKDGLRHGPSLDSAGKKGYIIEYQNGKPTLENLNFDDFLKQVGTITKEYKLKKQCDGRGKGLYIDKIQLTDKYTIAYFHYVSQFKGNSTIYTPKVGAKEAFTMQINDTKEVKPLVKHFYLLNDDRPKSMWFGEMFSFVLVFDKISPNTKNVSFIEGAEAYSVNAEGGYTHNWGCYDLELK